jgi:Protein of unknown function (DUF2889)
MSPVDATPDPRQVPVHRRTMAFDAYDDGEEIRVVARLRDERPWAGPVGAVEHLHDMELDVCVGKADLTIVSATATMDRFPHAECPSITGAFEGLVGLRVTRGYTRAVQERFGGARGCAHLEQLARAVGTVVVQAVTSGNARARNWSSLDHPSSEDAQPVNAARTMMRDTCHVWAEGGPAQRKLDAGWRPSPDEYPAPPVAVVLSRRPPEG